MLDPRGHENLLVRLHRLAHRQEENFTTEAFAHLVQHLMEAEPRATARVLDWLTDSSFFSEPGVSAPPTIRTQVHLGEHGIPDVRIEADDLEVIIEVKLGAGLGLEQAGPYAEALEKHGKPRRKLVALVGSPPSVEQRPAGMVVRTWGDLGVKLREETREPSSPLTHHLVEQFAAFLNHLNLVPLQVRSRLSEALKAHVDWAAANPGSPAVTRSRIRSLSRLTEMPHTEPLRNLLLQMDRVLARAPGVKRRMLDSGPSMTPPWIGFNINDMGYFFWVSLNEPEKISLQRYGRGVDPAAFDGSFGELERTPKGVALWSAKLDLLEPGLAFFESDEVAQEKMIAAFFQRAFAYGERLQVAPPAGAPG